MPKVALEIPELYESITRPVALGVIRQLVKTFGLPENTRVVFPGLVGNVVQPGSTLDDKGVENKFVGTDKFLINVTETYVEDNALSVAALRPEQNVFFADTDLDIYMKPVYQRVEMSITVKFRTEDYSGASTWVSTVKRQAAQGKDDHLHQLQYHYPLPQPFIVMLTQMHTMRETVAGYGETVGQYLADKFKPTMTSITNAAGNHPTTVIRESQDMVLGWVDFGHQPPTPQKTSGDTGPYEVEFTYKLHYDKPESVVLQYPLSIHNQMLPAKFYDARKSYELEDFNRTGNLSRDMFNYFQQGYNPGAYRAVVGLAIPHYDDWLPTIVMPYTQTLMRILMRVDPLDPTGLLSLTELGHWEFKDYALQYMLDYPQGVLTPRECVFNVTLHRKQSLMAIDQLTIDNELTIRTTDPMDLRSVYHLHIGLMNDLTKLTPPALARLAAHGEFAIELLKVFDPTLEARGLLPTLLGNGSVNLNNLQSAVRTVARQRYLDNVSWDYKWNLVGKFFITAKRR